MQLRLHILIQGSLIIILLVAQIWVTRQFEHQALEAVEARANEVANGAINGLNTLMVTRIGKDEAIHDKATRALFIQKMGAAEKIREMRIFRHKQLDSEFPPGPPEEQPVDDLDRDVLATGRTEFKLTRERTGYASLRTVVPFIASANFRTTNCLKCHGVAEGAVLGAASVTIDVTDDLAAIKKVDMVFWIGQGILQLILYFVIGLIVRRLSRQLGGEPAYVIDIVKRIAEGNLSQDIATQAGDSSSVLAAVKQMQEKRKLAEDALEQQRVKLADIVDFLPDATLAIDSDKRVIIWNKAIEEMTGIPAAEMIGQGDFAYSVPFYGEPRSQLMDLAFLDDAEIAARYPKIRYEGKSLVAEAFCNALHNNKGAWVFAKASPLHDPSGRVIGAIEIIRDIDAEKQQEENTRRLMLQMETILQHALVGIAYLKQRVVVSCNHGMEEIFGYEPGEMTGQSAEILYDSHETFVAVGDRSYAALSSVNRYSEEMTLKRKDGSIFWGAVTGSALDPTQPHEGSIWIYTDITERKQTDQELKEYHMHLEDIVQQRTAELSLALDEAKLADRAKDAFLANMSHELRTPLNAVIGLASLAQAMSVDTKQRDYLDKIVRSGKHLNRIINELLDLSKIAAGRMEFEITTFSLRELTEHIQSVMAHNAEDKGLELVQTIDPAVPDVLVGDPLRVEQIILNLVGNAIKFTNAGRVVVHVGLRERQPNRVALYIEVQDTGIGMPPEHLKHIFEPFSQADSSVSRKFGGTGLGLTICRRLTELMDGDISVSSVEGRGTIFRVQIKLELGSRADLPATARLDVQALPTRYKDVHVLVAEDQPINREIVAALLAEIGITPRMAENGLEALDILTQSGPDAFDLVLMDIQMPGMDGLTVTRTLRSRPQFAALPIIGMTAHTMEHEKKISADAGMNDHIGKPFDDASFYGTLAKWIPRAKQETAAPGAAGTPSPTVGNVSRLHSLRGVDVATTLQRFGGKEERYRHWLADFVNTAGAFSDSIRRELAAGDRERAAKAIHAFKGRVGMLGMTELHAIVFDLELALKADNPAENNIRALEQAIDAMREQLQQVLA